jgi:hypothetical protein
MLKIGVVSLIGLAALGWFVLGPGQKYLDDPPPTIRADAQPFKHRPHGYVAARNRERTIRISSRQTSQDAPAIDINLLLAR